MELVSSLEQNFRIKNIKLKENKLNNNIAKDR